MQKNFRVLKIVTATALGAALLSGVAALPALAKTVQPPQTIEAALAQSAPGWAQRDSAAQQSKAFEELLDMLVLDGSIRAPILLETAKLAKDDKTKAAQNYLDHFLKRLLHAQSNGLDKVLPPHGQQASPEQTIKAAERLMEGVVVLDRKTINIGEPGRVDWSAPWDTNKIYPGQDALHTSQVFLPLARAFLVTNDKKYLERWLAYLDDWTLNDDYFNRQHPLFVPDNVNAGTGGAVMATLQILATVMEPARGADEVLSRRIVAQVIRRFLNEQLLLPVVYIRSNTHNWTWSANLLRYAVVFQDFKPAQFYFREGLRRQVEDHLVTQNLRDGTENQQDHWYNAHFLRLANVFHVLEANSSLPGWGALKGDYEWRERMRRAFAERATHLIHNRTPQNNLPLAWNGGYNRTPEIGEYTEAPDAFHDPINQEILKAVNGDRDADPGFDSEWFPYGGFNIVREGWTRNSGYGAMFTSPAPGAYGGFRSRSNNNIFTLNAFGQDLLIDDATGHYMYPTSPLRVDGRNQFFHTGVYKVEAPQNHKVFQVDSWQKPGDWRWHASQNFNLMEGEYSGSYARQSDAVRVEGPYGTDESLSGTLPAGSGINDVTHSRTVLFARNAKLWIIDDTLKSPSAHEYSQQWIFPLRPTKEGVTPKEVRTGPSFDLSKITTDPATKTIRTDEATVPVKKDDNNFTDAQKANLSLHQFSTMPLEYSASQEDRGKEYNYYMYYSRGRVETKWKGTGDNQVITLAYPRAPGSGPEGELKSTKQITGGKSGVGFEAVTPDGVVVKYLSSTQKGDSLTLDNVAIEGESLLLSGNRGVALGATKFSVGGKEIKTNAADFEFVLTGSAPSFTPIYRPVLPVEIGPESNVFGSEVRVTLQSETPNVQIRYTLDGKEATPQSSLYKEPIRLTKTTTVLARAYRPGVTENPPHQGGTHASPISSARFEKTVVAPAVTPTRPNTGLNVNYYEGDWKPMILDLDKLKPTATAKGVALWDTKVIPASNPLVDKSGGSRQKFYALEYSGFLNVPDAGVYTLHAPHEYIWPSIDAGYELNVWLGNEIGKGVFAGRVVGKNHWYPSTRHHGFGTWSVVLEKGLHPFRVTFVDYRTDAASKLNRNGLKPFIWNGATPELKISGPGMEAQPIPASWQMRPLER